MRFPTHPANKPILRVHGGSARARAPQALRLGLVLVLGAALLGGCRADSMSAPPLTNCPGDPGCRTSPSAAIDASVYASLGDATSRLAPTVSDPAARADLMSALQALTDDLDRGRDADARTALAQVYAELLPLRVTLGSGVTGYPPDLAALRLDLVPVANALGVQTQ
jgi:hypothetical protein